MQSSNKSPDRAYEWTWERQCISPWKDSFTPTASPPASSTKPLLQLTLSEWLFFLYCSERASQVATEVKNLPANAGRCKRRGFNPWVGKIPWRRKWQPTPVFLPGEFHGQRSLVGYSPWCHTVGHDWSNLAYTHTHYWENRSSEEPPHRHISSAKISGQNLRPASCVRHSYLLSRHRGEVSLPFPP